MEIAAIKAIMNYILTQQYTLSPSSLCFSPELVKKPLENLALKFGKPVDRQHINLRMCQKGLQMSSTPKHWREYWSDVP